MRPCPRSRSQRISIHALREEGDAQLCDLLGNIGVFLSTPSARRATKTGNLTMHCYFISIHALREEGDDLHHPEIILPGKFLSTPSARRATAVRLAHAAEIPYFYPRPPRGGRPGTDCASIRRRSISIHALREEGDQSFAAV